MTTLSMPQSTTPSGTATRPTRTGVPGSVTPYAAYLAMFGEPDLAPQAAAQLAPTPATPVMAAATASIAAPVASTAAVLAPARRDLVMRDGVLGFVVGVIALSVVLVAAASFAATQS